MDSVSITARIDSVVSSAERRPRFQRVVDGLVLPAPVAGVPALDFCNTLAGWNSADQHDYLESYAHLTVWAREAGLVDAGTAARLREDAALAPREASRQLRRACALRQALYTACRDPAGADAWEAVAREARSAAGSSVLLPDAPPGRRWGVPARAGLALPVLALAREAGDLLATIDLRHVKACPGTVCGWLFVDRSGRRRWCTMAVCGNRAKARRHAQRARNDRQLDRGDG